MEETADDASESVRAGMRTAMGAATQAAQQVMRIREQCQREAQAASEQRTAELRTRLAAERSAARAALAPVERDDWWETATREQIAAMYETAHAWENNDPQICGAADRIREEITTRYGIDPTSLDRAAQIDSIATEERAEARQDIAAAAAIGVDVAAEDSDRSEADAHYVTASHHREEALWDSAGRREDLAASLEGVASAEAVDVRMVVDVGQGKPAHQAVTHALQKSTGFSQPAKRGKVITAVQHGYRPHA